MSAPSDFFRYEKGQLSAQGVSLARIAEETGTPVYVYSADAFLKPLRELQKGLASIDHLICFAVKSNSNLAVLKLLGQAGAGMDLVSSGEMRRALAAGVDPGKIVFSGVGKTIVEMRQALDRGIFSFNVESTAELKALSDTAVAAGKRAPVALRFNPDVDAKTHPYISTGLKKNKFGLQKNEILDVAKNIARYPGIDFRGLSLHIGSQLLSLKPFDDSFVRARELMEKLYAILPEPLRFMDLGGGLGITYKNEKAPLTSKYCQLILKHFGPKAKLKHPIKILIEPGRSVAGNAGALVTSVVYRKERSSKDFVIVDAAMNDLLRPTLYGSYHDVLPVAEARKRGKSKKTDIVGPVCESSDFLAQDRPFSTSVASGDLVAVMSAGAYGFTMSGNYNSRPRPTEVLIEDGKYRIIRQRETFEDLIRGELP